MQVCSFAINTMVQLSVLLVLHGISATTGMLVCPDGWFQHTNNQCYWPSDTTTTRTDAKSRCSTLNGTLVTVNTNDISLFLRQHILQNASYWIGLKMTNLQTTSWLWNNGYPFKDNADLHWCDKNAFTGCAVIDYKNISNACIKSYTCTQTRPYMCEKVTNSTSLCTGDWTGFSDGIQRCYYNSIRNETRMKAARDCVSLGSRLVTVTTYVTSVFVATNRPEGRVHWIGLSPFRWDDNTVYNWNNWDESGPHIGEPCVRLLSNGMWTSGNCSSHKYNYICQKDATVPPVTTRPVGTSTLTTIRSSTDSVHDYSTVTPTGVASIMTTDEHTDTGYSSYGIEGTIKPTVNDKTLLYILVGIYTAIGVTAIVFAGLLSKYISLKRRSKLGSEKPIEVEQDDDNPDEDDNYKLYDNPDYLSVEHQEPGTSSVKAMTQANVDDNLIYSETSESGQVLSNTSHKDVTTNGVPPSRINDIALEDISLTTNHEVINGDMYAVVDRSKSLQMSTAKLAPKENQTFENVALKQISDSTSNDGNKQTMPNHESSDHEDDGHVYYNNPHSFNTNSNFEDDNIYDDAINVTIPESVNSDTEDDKL